MNISEIIRSLGTLSIINFSLKHSDKLKAALDSDIAGRSPIVRTAVHELELAYSSRRPLLALQMSFTKRKNEADSVLDDCIRGISYDLLSPSILNGDREATEYRALFPDGTISFIYDPERVELVHVTGMVAYLNANPSHPMAGRSSDLKAKADALNATLEPQTAAEQAYLRALVLEAEKRETLCRALRKSVTFLRDKFDGDESKVDSFFPTIAEARVKEDEEEEAPATPAQPAPTA